MAYRTLVVGTDGSPTAEEAVRHAGQLAASFDAELVVVTAFVREPDREEERQAEAPSDVRWRLTDAGLADETARTGCELARKAGATRATAVSRDGDAAEVLIDTARSRSADVIVVGSKGMTAPSRFILGSVANTVSHHAPCDVLIVHTAP